MPAFLDIKDTTDISLLNNPEYSDLMKKRARSLTNGETQNLVNSRTCEYMNYIRHELACAYVRCISSGKDKLARQIQALPVLNGFDISNFSNSNTGRVVYKTPQLLKYPMKIEGETFAKQYYMGLQEDVPDSKKDTAFWDNVSARDREYIKLDENLTFTLAQLKKKYGKMDFVSDNVSSTYINAPKQFNF